MHLWKDNNLNEKKKNQILEILFSLICWFSNLYFFFFFQNFFTLLWNHIVMGLIWMRISNMMICFGLRLTDMISHDILRELWSEKKFARCNATHPQPMWLWASASIMLTANYANRAIKMISIEVNFPCYFLLWSLHSI